MSVKRIDILRHFEMNGYRFDREGGSHTIYSNGARKIPIKRHTVFDRISANQLCKQAGIPPKF